MWTALCPFPIKLLKPHLDFSAQWELRSDWYATLIMAKRYEDIDHDALLQSDVSWLHFSTGTYIL